MHRERVVHLDYFGVRSHPIHTAFEYFEGRFEEGMRYLHRGRRRGCKGGLKQGIISGVQKYRNGSFSGQQNVTNNNLQELRLHEASEKYRDVWFLDVH